MSLRLAEILKAKLKESDLGVPTLARKSRVPRQTISNWLAGQKPQNIEHVKAVADCFSMTVDELCFGQKVKTNREINATSPIETHLNEINAGIFEVILKRIPT